MDEALAGRPGGKENEHGEESGRGIHGKGEAGKSPEEIEAAAKEYGKELTPEKAQELFDKLKASAGRALSDDDIEAVTGGSIRIPTFVIPDYV